ncbi:MAG: hypothetical protein WCV72_03970 [Patescibacteria group bacterium]
MSIEFHIRLKNCDSASGAKLRKLIPQTLASVLDCECEILAEPSDTTHIAAELENYEQKLARLHSTLELISRDFGAPNPFTKTKKIDATRLQKAEQLAARAPQLARMKRFLIDLPAEPEFDRLRFLQNLVMQNLPFPEVFERPELVDAIALQAFENYHAEYSKKYLIFIEDRERAITVWQKQQKELEQKVFTLAALDQVKKLGRPVAQNLAAELAGVEKRHAPLGIKIIELRKILRIEPVIAGITFFTPLPDREFADFTERVDAALEQKFAKIRDESTLAVLKNTDDASVKKLTKLIALADLAKIVRIFTLRTAPKITAELTQLLR